MRLIANMEQSNAVALTKKDYLTSYGLNNIKAKKIWDKGCTGKDITIAIIDTGCDVNHPVLKDKILGGKNFTNDDNSNPDIYEDHNGHGTHVAGIVSSVAKDSKLLILKVLSKNGNGEYSWIANAVNYAIDQKVDIISMSLGGYEDNVWLHDAILKAIKNNILVVCAAGNAGDSNYQTDEKMFPGSYNEVIQVGAMDINYSVTNFSNSNKEVDLIAPGKDIISTCPNNTYAKMSGTSQATPFVSGSLALLKQYCREDFKRELDESELYAQLIKHTKTLKGIPRTLQGNGFLYLNILEK